MDVLLPLFFLLILAPVSKAEFDQPDCPISKCRHDGPLIKFPFRLKSDPPYCGNLEFEVSCSSNMTMIQLSSSSGLFPIQTIDYDVQYFDVYDACLPRRLLNFTISDTSLFKRAPYYWNMRSTTSPCHFSTENMILLNCSTALNFSTWNSNYYTPIKCLSAPGHHQVLAVPPSTSKFDLPLPVSSCTTVSKQLRLPLPYGPISESMQGRCDSVNLSFTWSLDHFPACRNCTGSCNLDVNSNRIDCYHYSYPLDRQQPPQDSHASTTRSMIIGVSIAGVFLISAIMVVAFLYYVRQSKSIEQKENRIKIEKFLDDHKSHVPTRYSYADIKKMTNGFKKKLGQGGFGSVFSGKLIPNGVPVAIKVLKDSKGNGEDFVNEVGTIGRIHHLNVVRLLGYSAEGGKRALIYEFMPNGSLEKFIASKDQSNDNTTSFDWEKLCKIITGIAKGMEYLHQGCDQRILHFDIKPHNILLDHDFNPKISDFGLAKLCSKEDSVISMTAARGTVGYIAPEVFNANFGTVSYKSDVYSFGMLVLEVIGARKESDFTSSNSEVYIPELIYKCLIRGEKLDLELGDDGDAQIAKRLAIVALWCIQWYPANRPSMKAVVRMLEGAFESLIIPPNPFASIIQMEPTTSSS